MAESFGQLGQCVGQLSWRFLKLNVYAVTQPKETAARLAVLCGHLSNGLEHIADRYTAEQLCEAAGHVLGHGIVFTAVPGALAGAGVGGRVVLDAVAGAKVGLTAASDMVKSAAAAKLVGQYGGEVVTAAVGAVKSSAGEGKLVKAVGEVAKKEIGWSLPEGGGIINGRRYTQHALERMAPDTLQVRAVLEQRAIQQGYMRGSKKFIDYVQPRGIPPIIVEDAIRNGEKSIGKNLETLEFSTDSIKVVVSKVSGSVITVHPK